jgi:hypothetical protein
MVSRRKKSKNNRFTYKDKAPNAITWISERGGIMFPPRARIQGRVALNSVNSYSAAANIYNYLDINNPISVASSQNMSGLAWLISGAQSNGTSYAPYNLGIVRTATIEVYGKTSASPNSATGALATLYPLPLAVTTSSISLTQAEEQFGRSNILEFPEGLDTLTRNKPLITKHYKLWELAGVSEQVYMSDFQAYSFGYAGLLSTASSQVICLQTGTENASNDTSLAIRLNIIVTLEIELFSRNNLITSAPHA